MKLRSKLAAIFLTVLFLCLSPDSQISASKSFLLTDSYNDNCYTVNIGDFAITIESDDYYGSFEAQSNFYTCCVYGGYFSFLGYTPIDGNNYQSVILNIDTATDTQKSYALNVQAGDSLLNFTADKFGSCYFTDKFNSRKLYCCSKDGIMYSLNADTEVRQLLCLDGENITVITYDGVYTVRNNMLCKSSDDIIDIPCSYASGGIIISQSGTEYSAENGELIPIIYESTPKADTTQQNTEIITQDNFYIVPQGTTVAKLKKALNIKNEAISVSKPDTSIVSSGKLGTGMKVSCNGSTRFIIIKGELTGEGNINSRDLKQMMKYITDEDAPTEITRNAADINCDGAISTKDLLMLANMY